MSDAAQKTSYDAGREHLGSVYAKALFGAAENAGQTEVVLQQLDSLVNDVLQKLPKFESALASPRVSQADKERMLEGAFGTRSPRVLVNALKVLAKHNRLDCLRQLQSAFRKFYNEARNRVEVQVRAAAPLNNQLLDQIQKKLSAMLQREVDIKVEFQPELLGGIVVGVGDTLFDGSLASKLENLRAQTFSQTEQSIRNSLDRFVTK